MKLGLVCPYDMGVPGGVQQLVSDLADQLRANGDDVIVVGAGSTAFEGAPAEEGLSVAAGPALSVPGNRSAVPVSIAPASWRRVRSALRDVDVVHVHEPLIPLVGWAALAADKPTVATFHADPPGWARTLYKWAPLVGRRLRRATVTAVSPVAAAAIPQRWGPVEIIPNAIDVDSFALPVSREMRRVAFLGRDDPRKGLDIVLDAWPDIMRARPDAELIVMGADRGVPPPGVVYLGRVTGEEKRRVLASSAVYVAPNTGGESFGLVVAEGMAAGCAVVASDLEAFAAVLGDAGRLFPVGDSGALTQEVATLLGDPEEAQRLGEAGRERVKRFDWSEVAAAYRSAYAEALR